MTEADFIAAVVAEPDSDLPRLVMADWLEEHGDPERAEFVRVQCELASIQGTQDPQCERAHIRDAHGYVDRDGNRVPCRDCWDALRRRERALLLIGARQWGPPINLPWTFCADLGPPPATVWPLYSFTRGFVSAVTLSWADWVRHAAALLAACPLTGKDSVVRLTTWPEVEGEAAGNGRDMTLRLRGRETRRRLTEREATERLAESGLMTFARLWGQRLRGELILELLAAEYPGVAFELPAAGGWDAPARSTPLADIQRLRDSTRRLGRPVVPHLPDRDAVRLIAAAHGRPDPFAAVTPEARP